MQVRGTYRLYPSGTAVSGAAVHLYDADDLVTPLISTTTGADGTWTISRDFSPGKFYIKIADAVNSVTRWISSRDTVMLGPNSSYDINYVLASLGDGVCRNVGNTFTTSGAALNTTVQSGSALVKGIVASSSGNTVMAHDAHEANPRKDRIVVRVTRLGQTDEGKSELAIIKGTAAASPALPSLTQSSSVWEYEIYEVEVPATSGAFTYTDRRTYIGGDAITRIPPTVHSLSTDTPITSFNTAGVLTSIFSGSVSTDNDVADGHYEAYLYCNVVSGKITAAAYSDAVTTELTGVSMTNATATGLVTVPVRVGFTARGTTASRTFGVAAFTTVGADITVLGISSFVTQFRRI